MTAPEAVCARIDAEFDAILGRWAEFLRIPSVSTDPAYNDQTRAAATWARDQLRDIGFEAALHETQGQPMVVAHHAGARPGAPRVLYYGHYDVQPPDPVEAWETGPFEPTLRDGPHGRRMIARGAVDDKGQVMTFLEALRAWKAVHGGLPVDVTVFLEGEEESGSPSLVPFLKAHGDLLKADVCVVSDTGMWDVDTPALTTQLRGLLYTELRIQGPASDLHSGLYGGLAPNPLNILAQVLGGLHDDRGRIAIPGFYDAVVDPDADTLAQWQALGAEEARVLAAIGAAGTGGERDRTLLERAWSRPTADINGTIGGYTGHGAKTVIPASASAKISFRLVPEQGPEDVGEAFRRFLAARMPESVTWSLDIHKGAPAMRVPTDSPYLAAARAALKDVYGREAALIGCGGSIPVVELFKRHLGLDTLLMGFALEDDGMHAPNEKFELTCLARGAKAHVALLDRFSAMAGSAASPRGPA